MGFAMRQPHPDDLTSGGSLSLPAMALTSPMRVGKSAPLAALTGRLQRRSTSKRWVRFYLDNRLSPAQLARLLRAEKPDFVQRSK